MWRILSTLGLLVLSVVFVALARLGVAVRSPEFLIGMFCAFLVWAVPTSQLSLLKCPRCHLPFFWHFPPISTVFFLFQSRCAQCRLPQYAADAEQPRRSNQAMQLTASKPAVYASGVCRRERMLRAMHRGLAAADLVSR